MNKRLVIIIPLVLLVLGAGVGGAVWLFGGHEAAHEHGAGDAWWTCPMHPSVRLQKPGLCPICKMELVPLGSGGGEREVQMTDEEARALAEIEVAPVERRHVHRWVRLVGKVDYDERRVETIAAWVPGRIERLYVDFTGTRVRQGDHLAELYSPELLTAQQELIAAADLAATDPEDDSVFLKQSSRSALESAREKLRLWGFSAEQIRQIEESGEASDRMTIRAPAGGIVTQKHVREGDYLKTGAPLFTIADLKNVWILMDAFESDLPWIHYGQKVAVQAEALPGETFFGRISFLQPVLQEKTRSVKVRASVDNPHLKLKPGMFVRARVRSTLGAGGQSIPGDFAGKWICPMHPEVLKDDAGQCDVCEMDLVPIEEQFQVADENRDPPLVVPADAVLITGERAVVYVKLDKPAPTFEGRDIVLGPRAGDFYVVAGGDLRAGERVVTKGNFKIDSALQIQGKKSMMNPEALDLHTGHQHGPSEPGDGHGSDDGSGASSPPDAAAERPEYRKDLDVTTTPAVRDALTDVYDAYLDLSRAMAAQDQVAARQRFAALGQAAAAVPPAPFVDDSLVLWKGLRAELQQAVRHAAEATDKASLQRAFKAASQAVIDLEERFGHSDGAVYVQAHCPMALQNEGASWLQRKTGKTNPYYGDVMLGCVSIEKRWAPLPDSVVGERPEQLVEPPKTSAAVLRALQPIYDHYFAAQDALAQDEFSAAQTAFAALKDALPPLDIAAMDDANAADWRRIREQLDKASARGAEADNIDAARLAFEDASAAVLRLESIFGHAGHATYYRHHCPMAFDNKGAPWLDESRVIRNPYFGSSMLTCGDAPEPLPGQGE